MTEPVEAVALLFGKVRALRTQDAYGTYLLVLLGRYLVVSTRPHVRILADVCLSSHLEYV